MASCICHVLCGTKRLRLERIVRPPIPHLPRPNTRAEQYNKTCRRALGWRLLGRSGGAWSARPKALTVSNPEADSGRSYWPRSHVCPKPSCIRNGCRHSSRACGVQTPRMSEVPHAAETPATTVRETRPNARVKPRRVVERSTWQAVSAMWFA